MVTRWCVFCGNLRDAAKGKCGRGAPRQQPTADRCPEDVQTTETRFDGHTGERLNPPPMPRRSVLASYAGDLAPTTSAHNGRTVLPT